MGLKFELSPQAYPPESTMVINERCLFNSFFVCLYRFAAQKREQRGTCAIVMSPTAFNMRRRQKLIEIKRNLLCKCQLQPCGPGRVINLF